MDETDRYGLFAQYDFELTGASLKNMASVRSQLSGLEKGIARVADAVNKSDFGRGLEAASRRAQRSTSKAGSEIDELAQALKNAEKRLRPLKREFRALRAEVRNTDFGELGEKGKFRQAAREVKNYINALKNLEAQIEGNTASEREFAATLKSQQRIAQSKLEMQQQQRAAALSAQRVGEFTALRDIGRNTLQPINQEIKKGVDLFSSFDDSMASVGAVSGATGRDLEKLRQTAKNLGASTRYTSFQAAEAEKYLATAGFKTAQILGTVSNALELASAGELDLARSADISSNILSGFRLQAEQLSAVVDTLALTSAAANTNIEQLGVAMSYAAPPASLFGATIEETSAFVGVMSNAGIQADKAGTAARSAFLRLASPVKQGKDALAMLGISTIDSSGNLRNFVDLMEDISTKLALDPETLKKIQMAGGDLELIENAIPDSKKIEALKGIFGTTGISGATAALTQMAEFKRLSLANLASSSNTDQLTEYFAQMGVKVAQGQDIFTALNEQAPDYQTAVSLITQANSQLMQSNLQTLSSLQRNKLYDYFKISRDKDLFTEITRSTQDSQKSIAQLNTAMSYLGIEMKVETRAARKMAKTMEDNLAGSFRALASAAEAVYINLIEPLSPIIRFVVDAITKVLLVIANAPYPIRLLIGSVIGLTAAMAATAVAVGTVGFFLFSFSQAAATAAIASQTLSSSLIPLTGFFQSSMLGFIGTNPLETFFQYNTELAEDFQSAWRRTSQKTVGGLEGIYKAVVTVTKATLMLSRAFLLSPITLWVGSFLLLNAFLEQAIPGFNLLGSVLGLVTAPLGFIWGLLKGIGQSIMEALGIVGGGTLNILTAPIHTFTTALSNALETFKTFSDRGEELGLYLGRAIVIPIENASILIDTIWRQVLGGIQIASLLAVMWIQGAWQGFVNRFQQILQPIVTFALNIAQQLINALNHNPTERIPEAWHKAVTLIKGYLSDLLTYAQNIGNRIAETGIAIATYFQNLIQSISNTVGVIGTVFRIVGKGISLLFKAFVFLETKAIQAVFLLGKATVWLYKTLFTVGLKALDLLKKTYDQAFATIQIFRSAFGYGEFSPDDRAIARQTLILGTLNAIGTAFSYVAQGGLVVVDVFRQMDQLVAKSIENFDLLTLALMTAASLPMTLIGMLDETAHLIVPELAMLTQPGLFRALVYAMPGIIATATATGITKGFQEGFTNAIAKLPDQLISKLDWANKLVPQDLRDEVDFALSEVFGRPIDTNAIYLQTRSFLDNQFRAFTEYLLQVGQTVKESSIALQEFLEPILEYDFGIFDIQTIPIITTIGPAFKAVVEVLKAPAVSGILQYLTFTVLPALGQTLLAVAEYLNNIRLILYLPFVSVAVRLIQIVTEKIQLLFAQVVPLSQRLLMLSKIIGVLAIQSVATFLRTIPYVGNFLANNFLFIVDVIATSFPIYINLLKRFISIDMLKALIPAYAKVVKGLIKGILYMFEQGFKPLAGLLFKALNPMGALKLLNLYIKTQGFKGIIKTPPLLDFFGVLNFINPFDVLFSVSKDLNGFIKMFSDSAELSYDMILKKQTMLFQSLRTNNPAFFKYMRMGALIPLEELLETAPGLVKFAVQLTRGLMLISPIVQIVGRIAIAFTVWYQILKPVNEEMLSAIASTEIMGHNLKLLADTIRVLRFLVVDGSDAFIWFALTVPKVINAVVVAFRVLGDTAYYVLHDVIALGILGFNALKITVINPLVVALLGATVALRVFLTVVQYALKFIRLKTQQYGDAIHQGFGAVMRQIASDVWGVVRFIGIQIGNAFSLITSAVHRTWKALTGLVSAIAHEIWLIIVDPVGEFNRLLILLVGEVNNQIEKTGTLLDRLPFKSVITLVQKYWKELMFAGGIALQFVKALNPAVRISLLLIDLAVTLVWQYETGFQKLDAIIQALSHPIALLDSMIKGLVNFLQGGLIPLDAADWISKFISTFIKMIPTVMGGFFVVALLIKRDIGGAFQLVSDKVLLFVGRIIQAVEAVKSLGYSMNRIYKGDFVQMNLLNAIHGVRSKDNLGPIQNPFAYSQDPIQQQVATGVGDQRRQKAEALLRYQKELDFLARQEQQRGERELIRQARSGRAELMNPEHRFYMESPDQPGVRVGMTGAQVQKRRNRFGIEEYVVTELGRSVMKSANQGYNALRYGDTEAAKEARRKAAEKSGLDRLYQEYHGRYADDNHLKKLVSTGDIEENILTRSTLSPLLKSFQDFFENIHVKDFQVNDLYVGRLANIKLKEQLMTPSALDYQVDIFKADKDRSLGQAQKEILNKYFPIHKMVTSKSFQGMRRLDNPNDPHMQGVINAIIGDLETSMVKEILSKYNADILLNQGKTELHSGFKPLLKKLFEDFDLSKSIDSPENQRVLKNFHLEFQKKQAQMMAAGLGDKQDEFLNFLNANRRAIMDGKDVEAGKITTGFDVITQGLKNIRLATNNAADELDGELGVTRKSFLRLIAEATGIPKLFEAMNIDYLLGRQVRSAERKINRSNRQAEKSQRLAQYRREEGLRAFLSNRGHTGSLDEALSSYEGSGVKSEAIDVLKHWRETGKFQRGLGKSERGDLRRIFGAIQTNALNGFNASRTKENEIHDLNSFAQLLNGMVSKKQGGFNEGHIADLLKYLEHGKKLPGSSVGVEEDRIKQILDQINNTLALSGTAKWDDQTLENMRSDIDRNANKENIPNMYKIFRQAVLRDRKFDPNKFLMTVDKEAIAKEIGLRYESQLRKIGETKLKNPFAQLKKTVRDYFFFFEENMRTFHEENLDRLENTREFLDRKLGKTFPFLKITERFQSVINGYNSFADKVQGQYLSFKNIGFGKFQNAGKFFSEQITFISSIQRALNKFKADKGNNFEGFLEDVSQNQKRKATRRSFQAQFYKELLRSGMDYKDVQKTMLALYKRKGDDKTFRQEMQDLKLTPEAIASVKKILSQVSSMTEDEIGKKLLDKKGLSLKGMMPVQFYIAQEIPGILKGMFKDVRTITAKAIKVSKLDKLMGRIFVDIAAGLQQTIAPGMRFFIGTQGRALSKLALSASNNIRKVFGENFVEKWFSDLSGWLFKNSRQMAKEVKKLGKGSNSVTAKILDAGKFLFVTLADGIRAAANALANPKSIWASIQGFFGKVKNFFGKLFPKRPATLAEIDQQIARNQMILKQAKHKQNKNQMTPLWEEKFRRHKDPTDKYINNEVERRYQSYQNAIKLQESSGRELKRLKLEREVLTSTPKTLATRVTGLSHKIPHIQRKAAGRKSQIEAVDEVLSGLTDPSHKESAEIYDQLQRKRERIKKRFKSINQWLINESEISGSYRDIPTTLELKTAQNKKIEEINSAIAEARQGIGALIKGGRSNKAKSVKDLQDQIKKSKVKKVLASQYQMDGKRIKKYWSLYDRMDDHVSTLKELSEQIRGMEKQNPDLKNYRKKSYTNTLGDIESRRSILQSEYDKNLAEIEKLKEQKKWIAARTSPFLVFMSDLAVLTHNVGSNISDLVTNQKFKKVDLFKQTARSFKEFKEKVTPEISKIFATLSQKGANATARLSQYFQNAARRSEIAWRRSQREIEGKTWPGWLKAAYRVGKTLVMTLNHGTTDVISKAWGRTRIAATENMNQMVESAQEAGKGIQQGLGQSLEKTEGFFSKLKHQIMDWAFPVRKINRQIEALKPAHQAAKESYESQKVYTFKDGRKKQQKYRKFDSLNSQLEQLEAQKEAQQMMSRLSRFMGGLFPGRQFKSPQQYPKLARIALKRFYRRFNNFFGGLFKEKSRQFKLPAMNFSSPRINVGKSMEDASRRVVLAWKRAGREIRGKEWPTLIKSAYRVGKTLVNFLNHGAADITAQAWERTENSASQSMHQMAQTAQQTGKQIQGTFERAINKTLHLFGLLGQSIGNVGRAGMAIGGVVSATGFAAQSIFYSLSNIGLIDEETSQSLYKVTELVSIFGAVAGIGTPLVMALTSSLAAFGSIAATAATAVMGLGRALSLAVGLGASPFAPLVLGIGAVSLAVFGLYKAFQSNFLGIRDTIQNTLIVPIEFIQSAWEGFVAKFGGILTPIVKPALDVAQHLINALNHNPTERIPEAWEGAKERIQGSLTTLVDPVYKIGNELNKALETPDGERKHLVNTAKEKLTGVKFEDKGYLDRFKQWFSSLQESVTSVFSQNLITNNKLDVQTELMQRQLKIHELQQAQNLWRSISNRDRNPKIQKFLENKQWFQSIKGAVNKTPIKSFAGTFAGKQLTKVGGFLSMIMGLSGGPLLSLSLGIGAVTTALAVLYAVIADDFGGIRTKLEKVVSKVTDLFLASVQAIKSAWIGFVGWFFDIPLVQGALLIAQGLINALNHNPTERIPEAWEGAIHRIQDMFGWLIAPAQAIASQLTNLFTPVTQWVSNLFKPKDKKAISSPEIAVPQQKEAQTIVYNKISSTSLAIGAIAADITSEILKLGFKIGKVVLGISLFKRQVAVDTQRTIDAISQLGLSVASKGGIVFPNIIETLGFAVIGKVIAAGMGGMKLFTGVQSLLTIVTDIKKELKTMVDNKLNQYGIQTRGSHLKSKVESIDTKKIAKDITRETLRVGANDTKKIAKDITRETLRVGANIGTKIRPFQGYLPALGLLFPDLSMVGMGLIGLSYVFDKIPLYLQTVTKILPIITAISAAMAGFLLILEVATKDINVLGVLIGSVAFVVRGLLGFFKGIRQSFKDTFAHLPYIEDLINTIKRLGQAGEDFGYNLGYNLTQALLNPIDTIKNAWLGFSEWFSNLPLVSHALNIATGLINALNHNPTERIPEAWDVATTRISGMLDNTVSVAQQTGKQMTTALSTGVNTVKTGAIAVRDTSVDVVQNIRQVDDLKLAVTQGFSELKPILDIQNLILTETRKVVEEAIAINTAIQEYVRPKPITTPEKGEKVAKSYTNWFDHLFNNPMSEQIALRQNQLIQEMVNNSKSNSLTLSSEFSKYVFKEEKTGKTELTKEGQIYLETKLAKEYRDHEGAFSEEILQYFASLYNRTKEQVYQEGLQKQPIIKEVIKALPETQKSLAEKQSIPGNKIAGSFNPLGQKGFLGIGGNESTWREDYTILNSPTTLGGIERGLLSIEDIARSQLEKISNVALDFFQGGEASIRDRVRQQVLARQNQLIYEMANNSISESSVLRSEFSKYITRGKYGKPELTQEGQAYLETKLAKEYRDRQGAFSNEILEYFAGTSGKTADQVYDIGLQGQPIIREAIKALPEKEKSLAEKIAPQIDRVVQVLVDILSELNKIAPQIDRVVQVLVDILSELNTILIHIIPITTSFQKTPSQLLSSSETPIEFIPPPKPKRSLWDKIINYFSEYYAKTKVDYKIPSEITGTVVKDTGKNNIVPYHPKSVGDVVNPVIQEKTSKIIPAIQQKASQIIPAAQQVVGGLAQRWQQHRKSKPVVDDLVTNAETEWDDKESWWDKNFKSIRESWTNTVSTIQSGIDRLTKKAPEQGYELQKGLAEGSPGPTFYIRKYWKKTINQVTDWIGDLTDSAAKAGIDLAQSLGVKTVKTAIAVTPFVSETAKSQAIQNIESGLLSIQDRYDYLKAQGFGSLGILFEPGAEQVTDALQLLGGDIVDFAKRSVKALLTLNLGELAQASKDFGGNLGFALKGLTAGFNSMGLSAIAAGAAVLTGMAPAIITIGAIAFGAAVILANFLGIRSILKGVIQILVATGKIAFFTFVTAGRVLKGFSLILRGLLGDSELVKQGIAEIKDAFQILGQQLKLEFKAIGQGFLSIGEGLKIALIQIFPFLKQPLQDLKQWFDEFWSVFALSPEWAGRMAAEALIDFVKNTFRAFNNLRLSVIGTWQKTMAWFKLELWQVKDWVVEAFRKMSQFDFSFLQDIPDLLLKGFKQVTEKIPTLFNRTGKESSNQFLQPIKDGFNAIAQFAKGFSDRINEELELVFPGWMKSLGQSLIPLFDALYQGVGQLRQGIFDLAVQWVKLAVGFNLPMGYTVFEFLDNLLKRFQSTILSIEKAWLKFFVNAGKLEWNQITEDIGNSLRSGFKALAISVGQLWSQMWSTVLEAPTLKGKVDAFISNFSFLSILNYVDDVAIAFDNLREKVGQVTSWLSKLIGTWNQFADSTPKLQLNIDSAELETKANNLIDKVQGKWNQLVKFFENPKWPTARQTWQGLLDGYGWLRSQFKAITSWFGRTPEMLAPFFEQLKSGADKVSEFLFQMELRWTKLSLAFNLPLPYKLFEFISAIPALFKKGVIQIETSWKWLANEIANLNWKTLTHVWKGFSKLFGLLGTALDFAENKWRELQSHILASPQFLAPIFEKLRNGLQGFGNFVVNLSRKWEIFITRFRLNLPLQGFFAELYYFSENFQEVITEIEVKWGRFATWLGTTELFSNILGGLKNLSFAFGGVTGFIGRHWNQLIDFLRSTQLLVHLGNGIVILIEFIDNLSTHINNLKQRWTTFLEANEATVSRIKQAWEGFTEKFKTILKPIVDFALDIAQKLINALNHNPTERIPEAWQKAIELIQGGLGGLVSFAKDIGKQLISALVGKENADKLFGNLQEIKDNIFNLIDPVKTLGNLGQGVVSAFNLISEALPRLLNPMKLFNDVIEASNYAMGVMSLSIPEQIPIWRSLFVVIGDDLVLAFKSLAIMVGENLISAFKSLDQWLTSISNSLGDTIPVLKPFLLALDFTRKLLQDLTINFAKFSAGFGVGFIKGFVGEIQNLYNALVKFKEPLMTILETFGKVFSFVKDGVPKAFSEISKLFTPVQKVVTEVNNGLVTAAPATTAIASSVSSVAGSVTTVANGVQGITGNVTTAATAITNVVNGVTNAANGVQTITTGVTEFGNSVANVNNEIGQTTTAIAETAKQIIDMFRIGEDFVRKFGSASVAAFTSIVDISRTLITVFADLLNKYAVPFLKILARIAKFVAYFSKGLLQGFFTEIPKVTPAFVGIGKAILKILGALKRLAPVAAIAVAGFYGFNTLLSTLTSVDLAAIALVTGAIGTLVLNFKNLFDTTKSYTEVAESLGNKIGEIFGTMVNIAVGGVKNAITVFAELLDAIAHPIQTVKKLGDVIKSVPSEAWKVVVEATRSAGEEIRSLIGGAFDWVSEKITDVTESILGKWQGMFGGIIKQLERFTGKTKVEGQKNVSHLSDNSPGPTYMIRKKWFEMLEAIKGRVQGFTSFTRQQGQQIQSAMTTSPQLSLANQISQYSQLTEKLSKVARLQNQINQRRKTDSSAPFNQAANRATVKLDRARTQILQEQSTLIESLKQSDLVSPRHLSQLDKQQARLNEITLAQQSLNQRIEAGNISRGNAQGKQAKLDRQQIQALERQSALIQEIEQAQTASVQHLGGGLRGTLISMGSLLSNFAPQLATPLFVLNDFIDAFTDLRGLLPSLQAGMVAWGSAIAASNSFAAGTFTVLKVAALKAYTTLLAPILPFLPIILGIAAAVGLFYLAFKSNFLGIRDLIYGVGWAFKKFFGDLLGGFFTAIGSIFTTIDQEVKAIASLFGELVYTVISIFDPILKLFNIDVSQSVLSLSDILSGVVNVLLFPIRVLVKSLNFLIKSISWGIQLIIKSLIFVVNIIKGILSFVGELLKSILIIGATIGGIVAILNFGAIVAGIVGAAASVAGIIGTIGGIISGIVSGIMFITPFLAAGLAGALTVIGGAIASAAVAIAPIIAGIAAIIGVAFVIKKIFEGILWVITSIAKGIWDIVTNPMKFLANVAKFIQDIFSGITGAISGLFNAIKGVGSLLGNVFSKIGQGINTVIGWIMAPVNILVNSISSLFSLLSNPLGFLSNIPIVGRFFGGQPKTEKPPGYATGGLVKGPGTRTGDRVHAKLSPGEYVINAIAAKANLPLLHTINKAKAGMMPIPPIMAMPTFAPLPFFPPTQSESVGEQEININLNFGDIIVNGETGDDLVKDFIDKLRSPQAKMEIRQIMREFVERMR